MRSTYRFQDAGEISVKSVSALDDGDLLVAGLACDFAEDREKEAFTEDAFRRGLGKFLNGPAALCWMHKQEVVLGKVLTARVVEGVGVEITARVDRQLPSSPYYHVYSGIKKGSISALSFGGYFEKEKGPNGVKIVGVDLTELSVCANGVGRSTRFAVIAGKALADNGEQAEAVAKAKAVATLKRDVSKLTTDVELGSVESEIRRVEAERASLRTQATLDALAADEDANRARYQHRKALHAAAQPERAILIESGSANGFGVVSERPTLDAVQSAAREASWAAHRDAVEARYQHACTEARANGQPEPWRPMGPLPLAAPSWWSNTEGQTTVTTLDERNSLEDGEVETPTNVDAFGRPLLPPVEEMLSPEDQLRLAAASAEEKPGLIERFREKFKEMTESKRHLEPQWEKPKTGIYHPYADARSPEQIFAEIARNEAALAAEGIDYE